MALTQVGTNMISSGGGSIATNTALGNSALNSNTTGAFNDAFGSNAAASNTTGTNINAFGAYTLNKNTTGIVNSAFGGSNTIPALYNNTTGSYNCAFGTGALFSNTTASNNTAVGYQAGYSNTTGAYNTFVGYQAGYTSAVSSATAANTCVGYQTGYSLTTGHSNTFIGAGQNYAAGAAITTGTKNTIIGAYNGNLGGLDIRTSSNMIVLSDGDGNPRIVNGAYQTGSGTWGFASGVTTIGNGTNANTTDGILFLSGNDYSGRGPYINGTANGAVKWAVGSYSALISGTNQYLTCQNTSGGVYLNGASATSWTAVSDETRKVIIEDITDGANKVASLRTVIGRLKTDDESVRRPYLIAQDVQAVLPEAVTQTEDKEGAVLGLSYTEVIPLLVAAIKELKAEIDSLKQQLGK